MLSSFVLPHPHPAPGSCHLFVEIAHDLFRNGMLYPASSAPSLYRWHARWACQGTSFCFGNKLHELGDHPVTSEQRAEMQGAMIPNCAGSLPVFRCNSKCWCWSVMPPMFLSQCFFSPQTQEERGGRKHLSFALQNWLPLLCYFKGEKTCLYVKAKIFIGLKGFLQIHLWRRTFARNPSLNHAQIYRVHIF